MGWRAAREGFRVALHTRPMPDNETLAHRHQERMTGLTFLGYDPLLGGSSDPLLDDCDGTTMPKQSATVPLCDCPIHTGNETKGAGLGIAGRGGAGQGRQAPGIWGTELTFLPSEPLLGLSDANPRCKLSLELMTCIRKHLSQAQCLQGTFDASVRESDVCLSSGDNSPFLFTPTGKSFQQSRDSGKMSVSQ